jgi:hypothetical protein
MTDIAPSVEWTETLECYFRDTAERANGLGWIHKKSEARYAGLRNWSDLPCIILGVLNSATSVGSGTLFDDPKWASIGVGVVALVTAILGTISSYFKWAARAEAHRISSLQFAKLHRFVAVQLSLPRDERMPCADLLKYVRDAYDRLAEISPLVPPEVIAEFNKKFRTGDYASVAKPSEANGLEAVRIYHGPSDAITSVVTPGVHLQRPGSDGAASAFAVHGEGAAAGDDDQRRPSRGRVELVAAAHGEPVGGDGKI